MDLPLGKFRDKGVPIDNVSNYDSAKENIVFAASQSDLNLYRVIFATKQAMLKVVDGGEFDVAKRTVAATKLQEDDEVVSVVTYQGNSVILSYSLKTDIFCGLHWKRFPRRKRARSACVA